MANSTNITINCAKLLVLVSIPLSSVLFAIPSADAAIKPAYTYYGSGRIKSVCLGSSCSEYLDESYKGNRGRLSKRSTAAKSVVYSYRSGPAGRVGTRDLYIGDRLVSRARYDFAQRLKSIEKFSYDNSGRAVDVRLVSATPADQGKPVVIDVQKIAKDLLVSIVNPSIYEVVNITPDSTRTIVQFKLQGGDIRVWVDPDQLTSGLQDYEQEAVLALRRFASQRLVSKDGSDLSETHIDGLRGFETPLFKEINKSGRAIEADITTPMYKAILKADVLNGIVSAKRTSLEKLISRRSGDDLVEKAKQMVRTAGLPGDSIMSFGILRDGSHMGISFTETIWVELDAAGEALALHFGDEVTLKDVLKQAAKILEPFGDVKVLSARDEGGRIQLECGVQEQAGVDGPTIIHSSIWMTVYPESGVIEADPAMVTALEGARRELQNRGIINAPTEAICVRCIADGGSASVRLRSGSAEFEFRWDDLSSGVTLEKIEPVMDEARVELSRILESVNAKLNPVTPIGGRIDGYGPSGYGSIWVQYGMGETSIFGNAGVDVEIRESNVQLMNPDLVEAAGAARYEVMSRAGVLGGDTHTMLMARVEGFVPQHQFFYRTADRFDIIYDWSGDSRYDMPSYSRVFRIWDQQTGVEYLQTAKERVAASIAGGRDIAVELTVADWFFENDQMLRITLMDRDGKTYEARADLQTGAVEVDNRIEDRIQAAKEELIRLLNPETVEVSGYEIADDQSLFINFLLPHASVKGKVVGDALTLPTEGGFDLLTAAADARHELNRIFKQSHQDVAPESFINGILLLERPIEGSGISPAVLIYAVAAGHDIKIEYEAGFFGYSVYSEEYARHSAQRIIRTMIDQETGADLAASAVDAVIRKYGVDARVAGVAQHDPAAGEMVLAVETVPGYRFDVRVNRQGAILNVEPSAYMKQRMEMAVQAVAEKLNADPAEIGIAETRWENGVWTYAAAFKYGEHDWRSGRVDVRDYAGTLAPSGSDAPSFDGGMEVDPDVVAANQSARTHLAEGVASSENEFRTRWVEGGKGIYEFGLESDHFEARYLVSPDKEQPEPVELHYLGKNGPEDVLGRAQAEAREYFGGEDFQIDQFYLVQEGGQELGTLVFEFKSADGERFASLVNLGEVDEWSDPVDEWFILPIGDGWLDPDDMSSSVMEEELQNTAMDQILDMHWVQDQQSEQSEDERFAAPEEPGRELIAGNPLS